MFNVLVCFVLYIRVHNHIIDQIFFIPGPIASHSEFYLGVEPLPAHPAARLSGSVVGTGNGRDRATKAVELLQRFARNRVRNREVYVEHPSL